MNHTIYYTDDIIVSKDFNCNITTLHNTICNNIDISEYLRKNGKLILFFII